MIRAALIEWIKYMRVRYAFKWGEIERELKWPEDSLNGVDLDTFTNDELNTIRNGLIELIRRKRKVKKYLESEVG